MVFSPEDICVAGHPISKAPTASAGPTCVLTRLGAPCGAASNLLPRTSLSWCGRGLGGRAGGGQYSRTPPTLVPPLCEYNGWMDGVANPTSPFAQPPGEGGGRHLPQKSRALKALRKIFLQLQCSCNGKAWFGSWLIVWGRLSFGNRSPGGWGTVQGGDGGDVLAQTIGLQFLGGRAWGALPD